MKKEKKTSHPQEKKGEKFEMYEGRERRVVAHHPEWELEKQTEGLTPSIEKAGKKLEKEMKDEAEKRLIKRVNGNIV